MKSLNHKGFTLIELLVVISIIGLLSSVAMASLSTARTKARDAFVKQQVLELRKIFELHRYDSTSPSSLTVTSSYTPNANRIGNNVGGSGGQRDCTTMFNDPGTNLISTLKPQAIAICEALVKNYPTSQVQLEVSSNAKYYTIRADLYNSEYLCVDGNGSISDQGFWVSASPSPTPPTVAGWNPVACQ